MPTIDSLDAFIPRATPARGASRLSALTYAASMRSLRPASRPAFWGPPMPLPPEKNTRSAPSSINRVRLASGGTSAAASTITGTPASVGDLAHFTHRQAAFQQRLEYGRHGAGAIGDRSVELVGRAGARHAPFDDPRPRQLERHVVAVALSPEDDHLVLHARRVGQLLYPGPVDAGHTGCDGDGPGRRRSRSNHARFGPACPRHHLARRPVEFDHVDEARRRLVHGAEDFGPHEAAAQPRHPALGVDDRLYAQPGIRFGGSERRRRPGH